MRALIVIGFRKYFAKSDGMARRQRLCLILAIGLLLLAVYVGSYYHLSRRGMREARTCNMKGFLYVPLDEALASEDLSTHHARARLYAPLNRTDQLLFDADGPVRCILWGLSD